VNTKKNKIAITTSSFAKHDSVPLDILKKKFEVRSNSFGRKLDKKEIVHLCAESVGIVAGTEPYDRDVLKNLKSLKVISRCGVGTESIDMNAASELDISIYNTPDAPTLAVAELTVGLILNLLRKINKMDVALRKGKFNKLMGGLLSGKKVGIIGFGRIGQKVAQLLAAFGSEIAYCDTESKDCALKCAKLSFEQILGWADIISLHASGSSGSGYLLGQNQLSLMKPSSFVINTSRGSLVDENALNNALKSGHLAGAALDVFEKEPYKGPLMELDNVILTPHIGSYAKESRIEMEKQAAENLIEGLGVR